MPVFEPSAARPDPLLLARRRMLRRLARVKAPARGSKTLDEYSLLRQASAALGEAVAADLAALARGGDLDGLRMFMRAQPLDARQLSSMPGAWMPAIFRSARADALAMLVSEWIAPHLSTPAIQRAGSGGAGRAVFSECWGSCLAAAMSRAGGDEPLLLQGERLWRAAQGPPGLASGEAFHHLLGEMAGRAAPDGFERFLRLSARLAAEADAAHLPTLASRLNGKFADAFAGLDDQDRNPESSPTRPRLLEHARSYLRWCAEVDMSGTAVGAWPRVLDMTGTMARHPELAPEVARLARIHGARSGLRVGPELLARVQCAGMGMHFWRGGVFESVDWEGRTFGPVDQALFCGSIQGARALLDCGVPWSAEDFCELCDRLAAAPTLRMDSTFAPAGPACERALALGQKLSLERSVLRLGSDVGRVARL